MEMKLVACRATDQPIKATRRAESTPESTHGGGRWQLGMPVQRGVLRSTCGNSRMSSRAMSRAFSRTKYGSRGCSLSRDSTVGTQENSRTQEFASIRIGGSCGLTGALAPWSERGYRSGRLRKALPDRPPHGSTAFSCGGGRGVRKNVLLVCFMKVRLRTPAGGLRWASAQLGPGASYCTLDGWAGHDRRGCWGTKDRLLGAVATAPAGQEGAPPPSNLCVEIAARKTALFSCQI